MSKSIAKAYFDSLPESTRASLRTLVHLGMDEGLIDGNGERSDERNKELQKLCEEYISAGRAETLERICNLLGIEADDHLEDMPAPGAGENREERIQQLRKISSGLGRSPLDSAKITMDEANEKYRRLTGSYMTFDERHAWKQRHLTRRERNALAMDSGGGKSATELFPESERFA